MSGISRLLRWAPCLWAISRLTNNSGNVQRTHILNAQPGSQHQTGTSDLLHSLSFSVRTVVKHSYRPRPSQAARPTPVQDTPSSDADSREEPWSVPRWLRTRHPEVHAGWQWELPPILPIRWGMKAHSITTKILIQVRGVSFGKPLPVELRSGILITVQNQVRRSQQLSELDLRLVCSDWNEMLRRTFWRKRWLNIRPRVAQWCLIAERIQALVRNAGAIRKVKMEGVLTDILPVSQEEAVRKCPELVDIALCKVKQVHIGKLDSINEVLLRQILLYHQDQIRHFSFCLDDTVLFMGRRSIFVNSSLVLPKVRKITVDISKMDELYGDSAGPVSRFVTELVGRQGQDEERHVELRLFCMPRPSESGHPQIEGDHIFLAEQIFSFARTLWEGIPGVRMIASFQGPLRSQVAHNLGMIRAWARENDISLINAPAPRLDQPRAI